MMVMAKKKEPPTDRNKHKPLGIRPHTRLMAALRELSKKNRRTLTAEFEIAIEKHLTESGIPFDPPIR